MLENIDRIIEFVTTLATVLFVICRSNSNLKKKIDEQTHHLVPNGGNSLRDVVDRIDARVQHLEATQRALLELQQVQAGHFLANKRGELIWVSDMFSQLLDVDKDECLKDDWLKGVALADQVGLFNSWGFKVRTGQPFSYTFNSASGQQLEMYAVPIINDKKEVLGFIGSIKP
jgi:hypothetical protein